MNILIKVWQIFVQVYNFFLLFRMSTIPLSFPFSLLQLDANLIEGEPYNRLTQLKNKRRLKWRDKIQIYQKYGKPVFKARQKQTASVGPSPVSSTPRLFSRPPTHPWVKKRHSLTLNTKLQLQLTIRTALVQDICLMTKNCVCTVKESKTTSKSINQIRPVLMPWWNVRTRGGGR